MKGKANTVEAQNPFCDATIAKSDVVYPALTLDS